ncbi:hypothetical protein R3P38DRAFT_2798392 [Favolaschia claudopus]|uniref:Uncharacterized protein n=1 Tax=Favolaschia claudopus TaxID=2862362 RepID=A0AAW0A2S6_9AGAR
MTFSHIEPSVFYDTVLQSKDWTEFLPKFNHVRLNDTGDVHALSSFTSATSVNSSFAFDSRDGYTWLIDRNSENDNSGPIALFSVTGFVTSCNLVVNGPQSVQSGPRRCMQTITISCFDETQFKDALVATELVSDFMLGADSNVTPLPAAMILGGLYRGITATTRVVTPTRHNSFEVMQIPKELDVKGYVQGWVNATGEQSFVYTCDNDVEVLNVIGIENTHEISGVLRNRQQQQPVQHHLQAMSQLRPLRAPLQQISWERVPETTEIYIKFLQYGGAQLEVLIIASLESTITANLMGKSARNDGDIHQVSPIWGAQLEVLIIPSLESTTTANLMGKSARNDGDIHQVSPIWGAQLEVLITASLESISTANLMGKSARNDGDIHQVSPIWASMGSDNYNLC